MKEEQIPAMNTEADQQMNYSLVQENSTLSAHDDLSEENGIAIRYSKDFSIVQANELLRSK